MTLYGSNTDTATTATDTTYGGATLLISALTTPSNKSVYILAPQFDYVFNTGTLEDVSGTVQALQIGVYSFRLRPIHLATTQHQLRLNRIWRT